MTEPGIAKNWTIRRTMGWAVFPALGFALGLWLRYRVIQPEGMGILCGQADAPGWCVPRQWLIVGQQHEMWGWIALVSAAVGLFVTLPRPLLRIVLSAALLFSALALILYNTTLGAPALVLALLGLLRRR